MRPWDTCPGLRGLLAMRGRHTGVCLFAYVSPNLLLVSLASGRLQPRVLLSSRPCARRRLLPGVSMARPLFRRLLMAPSPKACTEAVGLGGGQGRVLRAAALHMGQRQCRCVPVGAIAFHLARSWFISPFVGGQRGISDSLSGMNMMQHTQAGHVVEVVNAETVRSARRR